MAKFCIGYVRNIGTFSECSEGDVHSTVVMVIGGGLPSPNSCVNEDLKSELESL